LDLGAAAVRAQYCEHATMRVLPNDPLKNIEEALMTIPAPTLTTIGTEVPIRFAGGLLELVGTVLHEPATGLLVLDTRDGEPEERLSISLAAYEIFPDACDEVFVKDWSEGEGVAQSLIDAGLAEFVGEHVVGPFSSRAVRLRILKKQKD
jgi:hypothetical protein